MFVSFLTHFVCKSVRNVVDRNKIITISCILFLYVFDMQFVMLFLDVCLTVLAVCYDTGKNDQAVSLVQGEIECGGV